LARLDEGQFQNRISTNSSSDHGPRCKFTFAVKVPDSDFYEFAVGRRDNPIPSQEDSIYSQAEIEEGQSVSIALGL